VAGLPQARHLEAGEVVVTDLTDTAAAPEAAFEAEANDGAKKKADALPPAERQQSTPADPPSPCVHACVVRRRRRVVRFNGGMMPPDELPCRRASNGAHPPGQLEFGPFPAPPARAAL
jgi:hypothetical protein